MLQATEEIILAEGADLGGALRQKSHELVAKGHRHIGPTFQKDGTQLALQDISEDLYPA